MPAKFPQELFSAVNSARQKNGCAVVALSQQLVDAAGYMAEYTTEALKHNWGFHFHHVNTDWLYKREPDLQWNLLHATFPSGLPEWLGIFDVARACGYAGTAKDIIGQNNKTAANAVMGWLASTGPDGTTGHRSVLLWKEAKNGGVAKFGGGNNQIVVAVFGD